MGAWGAGAFEDDAALNWVDGPLGDDCESAIKAAIDAVMAVPPGEEIDYDTGAAGRAAAEAVAIVFGHPPDGLDGEIKESVLTNAGGLRRESDWPQRALDALARVWSDNSELNELWTEGDGEDDGDGWQEANSDLTNRLLLAKAG